MAIDFFARKAWWKNKLEHRELRKQYIVVEFSSLSEFNREIRQEKQGLRVTDK